jgi:hypothetical protein
VDIVFPIMHCLPLYDVARMPDGELARRQLVILQAMEARTDLKCVLKPFLNYCEDTFAHMQTVRSLRHVRVAHTTWTGYLARWQPRLIVLEVASTSLYETLHLDVDIFVMPDPVLPFSPGALELLRRRVHVFPTVEEMGEAIRLYGSKPMRQLRDRAFHDTYVNRGSAARLPDLLGQSVATPSRLTSVS